MNITFSRLLAPTDTELQQVQSIYESNFVPCERKPFDSIIPRITSGKYICLVARTEDEPRNIVAFALLMLLPETNLAFLEYIAVDITAQGRGCGSDFLLFTAAYFRENKLADGVIWEVEPPTDHPAENQNRRIRFYEKLGGEMLTHSTNYMMPDYELQSGGVPLRLMQLSLQQQPDKARVAAIVKDIYRVAYSESAKLRDEILSGLSKSV
jgi:ribosomal protein S18 acetylase RimI-like enzyme